MTLDMTPVPISLVFPNLGASTMTSNGFWTPKTPPRGCRGTISTMLHFEWLPRLPVPSLSSTGADFVRSDVAREVASPSCCRFQHRELVEWWNDLTYASLS